MSFVPDGLGKNHAMMLQNDCIKKRQQCCSFQLPSRLYTLLYFCLGLLLNLFMV